MSYVPAFFRYASPNGIGVRTIVEGANASSFIFKCISKRKLFMSEADVIAIFLMLSGVLFTEFFKLMNEVENEDLVFTLETIVDKFGEEMAPYAFGLCQNLVRPI